ncbi:uncharacterized protein TRIADDRAFT_53400 [Trichoplax adhaerens]|uniref:DNA repair protein SWI5 homolog n=1 Tax=Trichoplax adhaerens TaxID=10228 RepID=B3RP45_TRIAD|nr:hypothetical protein TRIADDRAFT_53400 [Trichoplax adhaerens]EDV28126.1 hypothetical protein TRIADDRAFT_53400 [Trichoplax adhaerens]|eukprot:XP_002109960.1 hypothetical protein TRIADDRAFT_53400 [Trichoplax adhaerens]
MEYDTDTIYTKVQTFCQNMQTPRTLEELMKDIHCYDENLLQDCIKRLPSTNGIYNEEDLALFIDKLHQYNEIKDIGQILLGKLAEVEGVLVKDLYDRFGLDMED